MRKEFPNPRQLTPRERAVLDALLEPEFPGVEELRSQATEILVGDTCSCGCASIDFAQPPATLGMRIWTEAIMKDNSGSMILSTQQTTATGLEVLYGIECFWHDGASRTELPAPDAFDVRVCDPAEDVRAEWGP